MSNREQLASVDTTFTEIVAGLDMSNQVTPFGEGIMQDAGPTLTEIIGLGDSACAGIVASWNEEAVPPSPAPAPKQIDSIY